MDTSIYFSRIVTLSCATDADVDADAHLIAETWDAEQIASQRSLVRALYD